MDTWETDRASPIGSDGGPSPEAAEGDDQEFDDNESDEEEKAGVQPPMGRQLKAVKSMPQDYVDNPEYVDVSKYKNKGILKRIIRPTEESVGPVQGNEVEVHYEGFLLSDGRKFDSSKDRGQTFKFKIGQGTVIQAWDQGVATMKKGEIAELVCAPEYAYGESGAGEDIPPNSVLRFVVELIDVRGEDISLKKDGTVLRRTLKKGEGYQTAQDGAKVKLSIIGRKKEAGEEFDRREVEFNLGDAEAHQLPTGINVAAKKLKLNEHAIFIIRGAASFTAEELKHGKFANVHAGDELEYEVVLLEFEHLKSPWEYGMTEKLPEAKRMKDLGTEYFKRGNYRQARVYYDRGTKLIKDKLVVGDAKKDEDDFAGGDENASDAGFDDEDRPQPEKNKKTTKPEKPTDPLNIEREEVLLTLYLNMSLVHLKEHNFQAAYSTAEDATELDANNVKAIYRRGLASLSMVEFDEAKQDFERVLELDPSNADAKKQLHALQSKRREQLQADKNLYKNMMSGLSKADSKHQLGAGDAVKQNGSAVLNGAEVN